MRSSLKIIGHMVIWLVRGKVIDLVFARPENVAKNTNLQEQVSYSNERKTDSY